MLYNFEGSTGLSARLHPAAQAKLSAEDAAIWQSEPLIFTDDQAAVPPHVCRPISTFMKVARSWLRLLLQSSSLCCRPYP